MNGRRRKRERKKGKEREEARKVWSRKKEIF